jgi:hypothetical protein
MRWEAIRADDDPEARSRGIGTRKGGWDDDDPTRTNDAHTLKLVRRYCIAGRADGEFSFWLHVGVSVGGGVDRVACMHMLVWIGWQAGLVGADGAVSEPWDLRR